MYNKNRSKQNYICRCSSMVEFQPSKLAMRVRFPLPAPKLYTTENKKKSQCGVLFLLNVNSWSFILPQLILWNQSKIISELRSNRESIYYILIYDILNIFHKWEHLFYSFMCKHRHYWLWIFIMFTK